MKPACRRFRAAAFPAFATAFTLALVLPAAAPAEPVTAITRPVGDGAGGGSDGVRFDRNGRFGVFISEAANLVPGISTGGRRNVYLYDRLADTVKLVSHAHGSPLVGGNGQVALGATPQISLDGNWVAYSSTSTDLVEGQTDTNNVDDLFLWSRLTDTTALVSAAANSINIAANGLSSLPGDGVAISGDGRYLAYTSFATNLIGNLVINFGPRQVYLYDRDAQASTLVSHTTSGIRVAGSESSDLAPSNGGRAISADGRWVVFTSSTTNLLFGFDTNNVPDVFLWDRTEPNANLSRLLSRRAGFPTEAGNGSSLACAISANGEFVAFTSNATNLEGVTTDNNGGSDVFYYDRLADLVELVSHAALNAGVTANGASSLPVLDAAGTTVAYQSRATNLNVVQSDTNGVEDVFFWQGAAAVLVSHVPTPLNVAGNGASTKPRIALDGAITFDSLATDLVTGIADENGETDVFLRPRGNSSVILASHVPSETATGSNLSTAGDVVLGGALVALRSTSADLVPVPANPSSIYLHGSLILADGFESGDFSAWSQHLP